MSMLENVIQDVMSIKAKGMAQDAKIDNTINGIKKMSDRLPEIMGPLAALIKDVLEKFGFKDVKADSIAELMSLNINDVVLRKMLSLILDNI